MTRYLTAEKLLSAIPRETDYVLTESPLDGETIRVRIISEDDRRLYRAAGDRLASVEVKGATQFIADPDPLADFILLRAMLKEPELTMAHVEQLGGLESPVILEMTGAGYAWNGWLVGEASGNTERLNKWAAARAIQKAIAAGALASVEAQPDGEEAKEGQAPATAAFRTEEAGEGPDAPVELPNPGAEQPDAV